jgi:Mg2+-importing ATPase
MDTAGYVKADEVPYDFLRKRLSIVVENAAKQHLMLTKGALTNVLDCVQPRRDAGWHADPDRHGQAGHPEHVEVGAPRDCGRSGWPEGRERGPGDRQGRRVRHDLPRFIFLEDPPKPGTLENVRDLEALGIRLKIITGDNRLAAAHLAAAIGLENTRLLNGPEMARMSDAALAKHAQEVDLFAEVEPQQKNG